MQGHGVSPFLLRTGQDYRLCGRVGAAARDGGCHGSHLPKKPLQGRAESSPKPFHEIFFFPTPKLKPAQGTRRGTSKGTGLCASRDAQKTPKARTNPTPRGNKSPTESGGSSPRPTPATPHGLSLRFGEHSGLFGGAERPRATGCFTPGDAVSAPGKKIKISPSPISRRTVSTSPYGTRRCKAGGVCVCPPRKPPHA